MTETVAVPQNHTNWIDTNFDGQISLTELHANPETNKTLSDALANLEQNETLSLQNITQLYEQLGFSVKEIQSIFDKLDLDSSDSIEYSELLF